MHAPQVPLLTVMESVAPVRVPGRLPLFQVWFDIQPVSFEGSAVLEDLDMSPLSKVWLPACTSPDARFLFHDALPPPLGWYWIQ